MMWTFAGTPFAPVAPAGWVLCADGRTMCREQALDLGGATSDWRRTSKEIASYDDLRQRWAALSREGVAQPSPDDGVALDAFAAAHPALAGQVNSWRDFSARWERGDEQAGELWAATLDYGVANRTVHPSLRNNDPTTQPGTPNPGAFVRDWTDDAVDTGQRRARMGTDYALLAGGVVVAGLGLWGLARLPKGRR